MNKWIFNTLIVLMSVSLSTSYMHAQVTIGSGKAPNKGALLDLKEEDKTDGSANSTKGLLLPRVEISTLKPLTGKLSESIGNTGTWNEKGHMGLMVYNAKNTLDVCTGGAYEGVYTWNGTEWLALFEKKSTPPTTENNTDIYDGANSYVVKPNTTATIPVKRAYDIWNAYIGTSSASGKVLDIADANGLSGTLTAEVVWQETGSINSVSISGANSSANLVVNAGSSMGNALIRVLIGGKALWQWHIWITNDDLPNSARIYRKNGKEEWYMDRFLGANAANDAGLYYQWGRNVPLPKDGNISAIKATNVEKENLTNAIQSDQFIIFGSTDSHDWYSTTKKQWDDRWGDLNGTNTNKSAFDPCPRGWRVPSASSDGKPWECFEKLPDTEKEYYPKGGYYSNGDGSLGDVNVAGYVWSASPVGSMAGVLYYNGNETNTWTAYNRANAMNVRCVKEK